MDNVGFFHKLDTVCGILEEMLHTPSTETKPCRGTVGKELEYFTNPEFYTDQNSKTKLRKSSHIKSYFKKGSKTVF